MRCVLIIIFLILPLGLWGSVQTDTTQYNPKKDSLKNEDHWLGSDKLKHFTASALIAGAGNYWMKYKQHCSLNQSRWTGFGISLGFGIGKEMLDVKHYRQFSFKDLIADLMGIIFGLWILSW